MKSFKELENLRINKDMNYGTLLKNGLITKEEFNLCIKKMGLRMKKQYEKDGFRTDTFTLKDLGSVK